MKHCYKRPKFDFYDAVAIECWLSCLAKQGLVYVSTNFAYFKFARSEPTNINYRVEPMTNENTTPSEEMLAAYNDAGWEFVGIHSGLFFIWKATSEGATELHSDPIVQSDSYRRLCKKLTRQAIATGIAVMAIFAMFIGGFIVSDRPVSLFLASPLHLALLTSEFFVVAQVVQQAKRALKIKKMLAGGLSLNHKKDYRKQYLWHRIVTVTSLLLSVMILITGILTLTTNWRKNIVDIEEVIPYIPLDAIEQSEDFVWNEPFYFNNDGIDYTNYADFSWTLFVPEHYEVYQSGGDQNHKWPDTSGYYSPSASTEYYRLSIPFFAPLLFNELMNIHLWEGDEQYIITEYDVFERTVIVENGYMKHLFVLEGNQVFYLRYHGYVDLSERLELLDKLIDGD